MKARSWACKTVVSGSMVALVYLALSQSIGVANGPGIPITPYEKGARVTVEDIEKVRTRSNSYRGISEVRTKGTEVPTFAERVGFVYVTGAGKLGEPNFELNGTTESGGGFAVPLSDVKDLKILEIEDHWFARDRVLLDVTIFPNIPPSELLESGLTYSQMVESHTRQMRMWLFLEDEEKGQLSMVGKKWEDNYEVLFAIRDLEPNIPVVLTWPMKRNAPIWWAVKSVIDDEKYPYRLIMLE